MTNHAPFPDVEVMLVDFLDPHGFVVTSTPGDLQARVADGSYVIRVQRSGGGESNNGIVDNPRVSVQVYGNRDRTRPRHVHDKAGEIRAAFLNLPHIVPDGGGRLDSATTESGPVNFPWPDPDVAAVQLIFRLSTRR